MGQVLAKLGIGVAVNVLAMSGADNTLGTWKRNVDKTKSTGGRAIKNLPTVREEPTAESRRRVRENIWMAPPSSPTTPPNMTVRSTRSPERLGIRFPLNR